MQRYCKNLKNAYYASKKIKKSIFFVPLALKRTEIFEKHQNILIFAELTHIKKLKNTKR